MKKFLLLVLCLLPFFSAYAKGFPAGDEQLPVVIDADQVEYIHEQQKVVASGNVKMTYQDIEVYCDRGTYDTAKNNAQLSGNIKIVRNANAQMEKPAQPADETPIVEPSGAIRMPDKKLDNISGQEATVYANDITYDFNAKRVVMDQIRAEYKPFFITAKDTERVGEEKIIFNKTSLTTCNLDKPHYRMLTKQIVIYPKHKIVAKNVTVKVGDITVFYFPYLAIPYFEGEFPFIFSFGKGNDWGTYFLSRWRYYINDQNRGRVYADWYEDRGFGTGFSHKVETKDYGEAILNYYQLQDKLYDTAKRPSLFEAYPDRTGIDAKRLEDDRYRANAAYDWHPDADNHVIAEYNQSSDKYFRKDFFYHEYETDQHPLTYIMAEHRFDYSSLSFLAQERTNKYWSETQYSPQLKYNFLRQNLGLDNLYFESQSEAAQLSYKYADSIIQEDAARLSTHNRFSYAQRAGWLNITPYVGSYSALYSHNRFGEQDIFRQAFETGTAFGTKLYRPFDANLRIFGTEITKMRHVLTPLVEYSYLHSPTVSQDNLYRFDGVDLLAHMHKIIFSLENKLQAKNDKQTWDLLYFNPSIDYVVDDGISAGHFDTAKADLEFYPIQGLSLSADAEYDCVDRWFNTVNSAVTISDWKNSKYSVSFGNQYLHKESPQGTLGLMYQLTQKFQFNGYWNYKYRYDKFTEQQYTLRTDLHCWWLDTGVKIDDDHEWTLWFAFTLKDFSGISFGFDKKYDGAKSSY